MSLTNDQITAKNFKEFYEAIRPYLNGGSKANAAGPTMVKLYDGASSANLRKNKILSTDDMIELSESIEHFDFIYIEYCSYKSTDANFPECTKASSITSVEHIKTISGYGGNCIENSTTFFTGNAPYSHRQAFGFYDTTHMAKCWEDYSGWSHNTDHVIVYGITAEPRTMYSTDEKIIGTWIDGKPLYQVTVELNYNKANVNEKNFDDVLPDGIENVIECISNYETTDDFNKTITSALPKLDNYSASVYWTSNMPKGLIACLGDTEKARVNKIYATIKYTKTTD